MEEIIVAKIKKLRQESLTGELTEEQTYAHDFAIIQLENVLREFKSQKS